MHAEFQCELCHANGLKGSIKTLFPLFSEIELFTEMHMLSKSGDDFSVSKAKFEGSL
jgi:hypothetical protein